MSITHYTSKTEYTSLLLTNKSEITKIVKICSDYLNELSINHKHSSLQQVVAKSLGYNTYAALLTNLPTKKIDTEEFLLNWSELCKSHYQCPFLSLNVVINKLIETGLAAKHLIFLFNKDKWKGDEPFFEEEGRPGFERTCPVYIFLDHQTCELYISKTTYDYSPPRFFFGIEQAWQISPFAEIDEISEILENEKSTFEAILNNSEIEWDGNNHVLIQTEEGKRLTDEIERMISFK